MPAGERFKYTKRYFVALLNDGLWRVIIRRTELDFVYLNDMTSASTNQVFFAFKEADIRGVYPTEINEEFTYLTARAFVERSGYRKVLIARDMRLSSAALRDAFVQGATDAGAAVVDLGLATTPMLYFASATMSLPGVMITASHSPKNFNGLKLVAPGAVPLTEAAGLKDIRTRLAKGKFSEDALKRGKVSAQDIKPAFFRFMKSCAKKITPKSSSVRIVVDYGNGMGALLDPFLTELGYKVTPLFAELDGTFPNRGSNPTVPKNQRNIIKMLKSGDYDFGIAFDGDADRLAFFDEQGRFVNCGAIGALIATQLLNKNPKAVMVSTVLTSQAFAGATKKSGGRLALSRVGHSYVKEVMRKKEALFGCEHSGHFFFRDFFGVDSVLLTLFQVMSAYRASNTNFSRLLAPHTDGFYQTEDLMVDTSNKKETMLRLEKFLRAQKPLTLKKFDGVTAEIGTARIVVKPSVTEAAINIIAEAPTRAAAMSLRDLVLAEARRVA